MDSCSHNDINTSSSSAERLAAEESNNNCLHDMQDDLHDEILDNLRRLSFSSMPSSTLSKGTQHHFTRNGRLVANKQLLYLIDRNDGLESVSTAPMSTSLPSRFVKSVATPHYVVSILVVLSCEFCF